MAIGDAEQGDEGGESSVWIDDGAVNGTLCNVADRSAAPGSDTDQAGVVCGDTGTDDNGERERLETLDGVPNRTTGGLFGGVVDWTGGAKGFPGEVKEERNRADSR